MDTVTLPATSSGDSPTPLPRQAIRNAVIATAVAAVVAVLAIEARIRVYYVGITWAESATGATRQAVMQRLSLYPVSPDTVGDSAPGRYLLTDTSPTNIAAIVRQPAIAATTNIDRAAAVAVDPTSEDLRSWLTFRFPRYEPPLARVHSAVRPITLIPLFAICLLVALAWRRDGRAWLIARVPSISPSALGLFRIAFTAVLWWCVMRSIAEEHRQICLAALAAFGIGVFPRVAFGVFAYTVTRAYAGSLDDHDIALPLKAFWLMILVPWGNGLSVHQLVRWLFRRPVHTQASRANGLAVWIPSAMLAIAYAAAAFAKIDDGGLHWVTGGAVRFIFIVDAPRAPLGWGRVIASSDTLSVLFSAAALAAESAMLIAVFWARPLVRLLAGLLAAALHLGFYLFQGLIWPWWWALMPAFLPWELAGDALQRRWPAAWSTRPAAIDGCRRLPAYAAIIVFVSVLQQPVASLFRLEYSFLLSDFPMYANIYGIDASKAEFAAFADRSYQPPAIVSFRRGAPDERLIAEQLREVDFEGRLADVIREIVKTGRPPDAGSAIVTAVGERYQQKYGAPPRIDAYADRWQFDWSTADFTPRHQPRLAATIDLAAGTIATPVDTASQP